MKKYQRLLAENCQFLEVKFSIYLTRRVFVVARRLPLGIVMPGIELSVESARLVL